MGTTAARVFRGACLLGGKLVFLLESRSSGFAHGPGENRSTKGSAIQKTPTLDERSILRL